MNVCIAQYRLQSINREGGVCIYQNVYDSQHNFTPYDDANLSQYLIITKTLFIIMIEQTNLVRKGKYKNIENYHEEK